MTFNLESLVLPDSQVHPFYTSSFRPILGSFSFRVRWCFVVGEGKRSEDKEASRDNRRLNTDSDSLVSEYNEHGCTPFRSTMPELSMVAYCRQCSAILSVQFTIVTVLKNYD